MIVYGPFTRLGYKDPWCVAVEAACAEVGLTTDVWIDLTNGGYEVRGPSPNLGEWTHDEWHAVHHALAICEPLRKCKASPSLEKALRGEKFCGDRFHADCTIREGVGRG